MKKYTIWLFVGAVVLLPLIPYGIVNWYQKTYSKLPFFGPGKHTVADFNLTDQNGKAVSIKDWDGNIVVADFFFTHCVAICSKMTANLKIVQENFPDDVQLQINSFSVDPERDSVARLSQYANQFKIIKNWHLLTGDKKDIYRLARKSFLLVATDGDGGANDFIHSEKLVLIDVKRRIRGYYDGTDSKDIALLINDINKLKKEND